MNKTVMSAAALALIGAGVFAFAQSQSPPAPALSASAMNVSDSSGMRSSSEDRAVLLEARIGAVKAVLKLTADQEKLWEPVVAVIRKSVGLRAQHIEEMRLRMARTSEAIEPAFDPVARLRRQADRMIEQAGMMREFADAAAPLYASLSDDQKRRAFLLINRTGDGMMGLGAGSSNGADGSAWGGVGRRGHFRRDVLDWRD